MTQKEIDNLTIFLGKNEAFISKRLKDGSISKLKKNLTETEILNFIVWFVKDKFASLNTDEFHLDVDGKPKYQFKLIKEEDGTNN